jgi:hypothetical protein
LRCLGSKVFQTPSGRTVLGQALNAGFAGFGG